MTEISLRRFVCPHCGSEDIQAPATAYWHKRDQKWRLEQVLPDYDQSLLCKECLKDLDFEEAVDSYQVTY